VTTSYSSKQFMGLHGKPARQNIGWWLWVCRWGNSSRLRSARSGPQATARPPTAASPCFWKWTLWVSGL